MHIVLFVILFILGIIMLVLSKESEDEEEPYWGIGLALIATIIFFSLSFGVMNINQPYEIYNATSGNIETGFHIYTGDWHFIWLFLGLGMFSFIIMWLQLFRGFGWIGKKAEKTPKMFKTKR